MRLAVHTDFEYHPVGGEIYGEHAFTLFIVELASQVERLVLLGRLGSAADRGRYPLGPKVEFVALPYYERLTRLRASVGGLAKALRSFWRALDQVDCVWLLGPHPFQPAFALIAAVRRRRIVLGVRQDFPAYVASRHPGRRGLWLVGWVLEGFWRILARFSGAVVVGPEVARRYHRARRLIEITASLVRGSEILDDAAPQRETGGELVALSVGRLEEEKNPLLLADILERLQTADPRWRLTVCGEGPMQPLLAERLEQLGLAGHARLTGYVPFGSRLTELYRGSDALLHVSWTEGLPQVLLEAFAAGLPVVATDVGGIRAAFADAVLLVPPGDAAAAAEALRRIVAEPELRARIVRAGSAHVRARTIEAETARVAAFLQDP